MLKDGEWVDDKVHSLDDTTELYAFEAGADAMLRALKAEGWRLKGESVVPAQGEFPEIHIPEKLKGYLVFIPDEEKNDKG